MLELYSMTYKMLIMLYLVKLNGLTTQNSIINIYLEGKMEEIMTIY